MGFSKMTQPDGLLLDSEGKKWVITGIALRTSLKPINTKSRGKEYEEEVDDDDDDDDDVCSTTPTSKESRIPDRLPCPPPPRKRQLPLNCHFNGVREFFNPPDLETLFKRHVEKAN